MIPEAETRTSPVAYIFLFLATTITGSLLSFLYLWFIQLYIDDFLNVFSAVGVGVAMGFVSSLVIKLFKIKSLAPALLAVVIGCLVFTNFKWALYVARDSSNEFSTSYIGWYFVNYADDFLDEGGNLLSDAELEKIVTDMRAMSAFEYKIAYEQEELWGLEFWSAEDLQFLKSITFYDYMEHPQYLSNGTVPQVVQAIKDEYSYSWFLYYRYIAEHGDFPTAIYYMTNPGELFEVISRINSEGRWAYNDNVVEGTLLRIVWLIEGLLICIFAVIAVPKAIKALNAPESATTVVAGMEVNTYGSDTDEYGRPIAHSGRYTNLMPPVTETAVNELPETPETPETPPESSEETPL
jgi:hypothetical protein